MARLISRQEAAQLLNVHPQTISNWVDSGILNGHFVNKFMMIDRKSIEQYFDTLEDLAFMEKRISIYKESLSEEQKALERDLADVRSARVFFGSGISPNFQYDIVASVVEVAGDTLLTERDRLIMRLLLDGKGIGDISDEVGVSWSRVSQILHRITYKLATMTKWPEYHREYKRTKQENEVLSSFVVSLERRVSELEGTIPSEESLADQEARLELVRVLNSNLFLDYSLTRRSLNCLKAAEIETVGDLVRFSRTDILKFRNCGKKTLLELDDLLASLNLHWSMDVDLFMEYEARKWLVEYKKTRQDGENDNLL